MRETIVILDFGGGNTQLLARRIRGLHVFCEIMPCNAPYGDIMDKQPKGLILIGGSGDANFEDAPMCDTRIFSGDIPVLGIGYGGRIMARALGGKLSEYDIGTQYHTEEVIVDSKAPLFDGIPMTIPVWLRRVQSITSLPTNFVETVKGVGFANKEKQLYGVLFHPEAAETEYGNRILKNFLFNLCGASDTWTMESYAEYAVEEIRKEVGDGKVLLALSGGVDSSVVAVLLNKAIGKNLTCIFVDTGLMRKNEGDEVMHIFGEEFDINLKRIDAEERFLDKLAGVEDPEQKRKIIGEEFVRVFEEEAKKIGRVQFLAQGTIYPDIIESGVGDAKLVKSHHNVGGLPEDIEFDSLIEPVRDLFKDEVRELGEVLGIPEHMVWRQPFPGPGLGIRVIGELTKEKLDVLREVDAIFRGEIALAGLDREIWQYFAVLTNIKSVGVTGDARTYQYMVALRAVNSIDAMTADWARIPFDVLARASKRIVDEVKEVNRVVYDITSKPPATIEWE